MPRGPGAVLFHTREVAGSKPAAPIGEVPAVEIVIPFDQGEHALIPPTRYDPPLVLTFADGTTLEWDGSKVVNASPEES